MTAPAYLRLRNVVKSYDGKSNAVDDVSIDIERGEFVTFLGPSGSGKTTTLLMIAGFEDPTAGSSSSLDTISRSASPMSAISVSCSRTTRCSRI